MKQRPQSVGKTLVQLLLSLMLIFSILAAVAGGVGVFLNFLLFSQIFPSSSTIFSVNVYIRHPAPGCHFGKLWHDPPSGLTH